MPRQLPFHAELSASTRLAEPVAGFVARFDLADGRRVDVQVPNAVACVTEACDVTGFRVVVRRANDLVAAELSATDLVDVFGARSAALALAAFTAGDLPRARRLAHRAGAPWLGLKRLLREVARRRQQQRATTQPGEIRSAQIDATTGRTAVIRPP